MVETEYLVGAVPAIVSGITVAGILYLCRIVRGVAQDNKHDRAVNEQSLMWQLRSVIWQPYYSYDEKRVAFEEYKARGGNHLTEEHFREIENREIAKMKETQDEYRKEDDC